jgi:hypothetical protein
MMYRLNKQQNYIEMSSRRICRAHQQNILDFCRRELLIGSRCGCLLAQKMILDRYMVLTCTYLLVIFYQDISYLTYYHQPCWYCYFKRKSQQRHLGKQKTGPNKKKVIYVVGILNHLYRLAMNCWGPVTGLHLRLT